MALRRLEYFTLLLGVFACYLVSGEWITMILLLAVLLAPLLSVLISLPAVLTTRLQVSLPEAVELGQEQELFLQETGRFPGLPFQGKLRLTAELTGKALTVQEGALLPTEHCGGWTVSVHRGRVCDYLGLVRFPARKGQPCRVAVRPEAVPVSLRQGLQEPASWVPRRTGGYAENYEHRFYRPGDELNRIHWKLSAKMDEFIVREPMDPARGIALLRLSLTGSPEELDRKLGRFLWAGSFYLARGMRVSVAALTGDGVTEGTADDREGLLSLLDSLLFSPMAESEPAGWQDSGGSYLGGQADEGQMESG